jgi:hypothetical protein
MMMVVLMSTSDSEYLKTVASIIEYRCNNILKVREMLEEDIKELHKSRNQRTRDVICGNIYNKIEYIEILLSKNIDDIMSVEIIEMDKLFKIKPMSELVSHMKPDDYSHYIQ